MADEEQKGIFGRVLKQIESFFTLQFQLFWRDFAPNASSIMVGLLNGFTSSARLDTREPFQQLADDLVRVGIIENGDVDKMRDIFAPMGAWQHIAVFINLMGVWFRSMNIKTDTLSSDYIQNLNKTFRPAVPDAASTIRAGFIAPELNPRIRENMRKLGLKEEDIDLIYAAQYATYPLEQIRVLSLREILNDEQTVIAMRELGLTDTRIKKLRASWEVIPGPQDLFWMVGKEAFEDDAIQKIGLGDEFPKDQLDWLKKQGVSEFWARKYWFAHWDEPSIGQGFEMYQREEIDDDELDLLFRAVELPPFWREKLKKIAYHPIGRIDLRRVNLMGVIPDEDLPQRYRWMGYSPEDADTMAEWTVLYNNRNTQDLGKAKVLQAYSIRAITRKEAKDLLTGLKINPATVEFLLKLQDFQESIDLQEDIIKDIRDRFLENLIDKPQTRSRLNKLNLSGERIDVLLSRWETQAYKDRKLPTQGQLDMFFQADIIDADEYQTSLLQAGYSFRLADLFIKLSKKIKKAKREASEEPGGVEAAREERLPTRSDLDRFYKADLIDSGEYYRRLLEINYQPEVAQMYVQLSALQKSKQQGK